MEILLNGQALFGWTYEQEELVEHMMKRILILPNSTQLIKKVRQHVSDPKAYNSWIVTCGNIFSVEIYIALFIISVSIIIGCFLLWFKVTSYMDMGLSFWRALFMSITR